MEEIRLTEMVSCAGCAAKLGPADLSIAVKGLFDEVATNPDLLVGFGTLDDAGVYRIDEERALVQTIDFITPLVDDPFTFGRIAVTNAISDVYAMGGTPLTGLNVVCFPSGFDPLVLREILRGGLAAMREAGVALLGGHSVDDKEIKFGAAITGLIDPRMILTNAGAQPGDTLILTKPLGTGIATTAIKQGKAPGATVEAAVASMCTLNRAARNAIVAVGANACTDVTGFSLMGHLHHMVKASQVTAVVHASALPHFPGVIDLARDGIFPGGSTRNQAHFGRDIDVDEAIDEAVIRLLFDPQTSGGLLVAVPENRLSDMLASLAENGVKPYVVGQVVHNSAGSIRVEG